MFIRDLTNLKIVKFIGTPTGPTDVWTIPIFLSFVGDAPTEKMLILQPHDWGWSENQYSKVNKKNTGDCPYPIVIYHIR